MALDAARGTVVAAVTETQRGVLSKTSGTDDDAVNGIDHGQINIVYDVASVKIAAYNSQVNATVTIDIALKTRLSHWRCRAQMWSILSANFAGQKHRLVQKGTRIAIPGLGAVFVHHLVCLVATATATADIAVPLGMY